MMLSGVCVALAFFFSMAHLSLRHVSWVRLEEYFNDDSPHQRAAWIKQRVDSLITTASLLRIFFGLGLLLSIVYFAVDRQWRQGEGNMEPVHLLVPLLGSALMTLILLSIFAEAIPHALAKTVGERFLVFCYPLLQVIYKLGWPISTALSFCTRPLRRLSKYSNGDSNARLDEKQEELLHVVHEREKEGVVDEEERDMIASVLEFRDTTTGEIMTPRTDTIGIEVNTDFAEIVRTVIKEGHSRYPVYEGAIDKIVGMLYAKDLLNLLNHNESSRKEDIHDHLRKVFFVPESKTVRDLLHDFQNQKMHIAVVLDEYGGTAGLVTIEDILEELVGEIEDEYETPQPEPLKKIDDHTWEVDARVHVDELNDKLNWKIPEDDDYETVGGFAFASLGYIPRSGETFEHDGLHFTILEVDQRRINRLTICVNPASNSKKTDETE